MSSLYPPYTVMHREDGLKVVLLYPYADKFFPDLAQLMLIAGKEFPQISSPNDICIMPGYMRLELSPRVPEKVTIV